jgi:phage terminase large subunit-like protein
MVGSFPALEDELCLWLPGDDSPNRLDAMVWAGTELMLEDEVTYQVIYEPVRIG